MGNTNDNPVFVLCWVLHLIGGLGFYTQCTTTIPLAIYKDNSEDWVTKSKCGDMKYVRWERLNAVYVLHATCYVLYMGAMFAITWFGYANPAFCSRAKVSRDIHTIEMGDKRVMAWKNDKRNSFN